MLFNRSSVGRIAGSHGVRGCRGPVSWLEDAPSRMSVADPGLSSFVIPGKIGIVVPLLFGWSNPRPQGSAEFVGFRDDKSSEEPFPDVEINFSWGLLYGPSAGCG